MVVRVSAIDNEVRVGDRKLDIKLFPKLWKNRVVPRKFHIKLLRSCRKTVFFIIAHFAIP